jgi:hypothetical protein
VTALCSAAVTRVQEQQADARAGRQPAARQHGAHDSAGDMHMQLQRQPAHSRVEQASPEAADAAETLCSLTFAARVRGVELNASRRKVDAVAVTKTALPPSEGKTTTALRASSTPNIDACKGTASAAKSAASAPPARATPRRLEKDVGCTAAASASQEPVRRSLDNENSGVGE